MLRQRFRFISFIATLEQREAKVLEMRCEKNMSWKQVAAAMDISRPTAERIFDKISQKAEKYGGIF